MRNDITYKDFLPLRDGLVSFACALLKSKDDAEDAVQELFMKLWKRKDTLSEIENPEAYCKTVLRNICLDSLDLAERRKKGNMPEDVEALTSVEDNLIVREQLGKVQKAISELPEGQKTVIIKKIVEDRSYDEVSAQTGMTNQTMRTQLSLARRTLRSRFAWGFAVAAIALAVFLAVPRQPKDTFTDPVLAYAEIERTLGYVSSKIDKGTAIARSAETKFEKVENIINEINF